MIKAGNLLALDLIPMLYPGGASMKQDSISVFDFDGTIASKDSAMEFFKWIFKGSITRSLIFYFLMPLLLLLTLTKTTRIYSFSIISYIATACQSRNLFRLRAEFVDYYLHDSGAVVFKGALEKIKLHQKQGDKIVIISGCPVWLLSGITKKLNLHNIRLIGSKLRFAQKGLLFKEHCYASNKIKMAKERGLNPETWNYGYSDSPADIHWLKNCKRIHVINPSPGKLKKFKNAINKEFTVLNWV
jgi:phosphatidylglycerophosphatase C